MIDGTDNGPKEMRFLAKMVSDNPDNKDREFSIIFSLLTDEIKVWENQSDGFDGGFVYKSPYALKRGKPDFAPMFLGSIVTINGIKYELTGAPENTYEIMEQNLNIFSQMDANKIIPKLRKYSRTIKEEINKCIIPGTDRIKLEDANRILTNCEANLSKNEVLAMVRKFRFYKTQTYSYHDLMAAIA